MSINPNLVSMLWVATLETLYMVAISTIFTVLLGVPLGVILVVTRRGHIWESFLVNKVLGFFVNVFRSIPFPVFIVAIIPVTRFLVGTSIGPTAVIVPLTLAAIVFLARLSESAMLEIPFGVIEAAQSSGASNWQIIWHVLLPEARAGMVIAVTILVITLISYSAMAGAVGGGGLGDLAIRYGYQRYQQDVMIATSILLIIVVQGIQSFGDWLSKRFRRS